MQKLYSFTYSLHNHFKSPVIDFFDQADKSEVGDLINQRITPSIPLSSYTSPQNIIVDLMTLYRGGIPYILKEGMIHLSAIHIILWRIGNLIMSRLPDNTIDPFVMIKILNGHMIYDYYSKGKSISPLLHKLETHEEDLIFFDIWEMVIPFFLEIDEHSLLPDRKQIDQIRHITDILSGKVIGNITSEDISSIEDLFGNKNQLFKISTEGLEYIKLKSGDKELLNAFKALRIKKNTLPDATLLIAVITSLFFKQLYIVFDIKLFKLTITDEPKNEILSSNVYVTMNLNEIAESIFCKGCFNQYYGKDKIKPFNIQKTNIETIKEIFDGVYKQLSHICPDDLQIEVTGKVNDKSRFKQVDDAIPYGKVGFGKHNGEKKHIQFSIQKDLKGEKKKLLGE